MKPKIVRLFSANSQFQHIETLRRNRAKRHKHNEFFVEGVRPINQALDYGWTINAFAYAAGQRLSGWAQDILRQSQASVHFELAPDLLVQLSNKTEPSELIAIVAMPEDDFSRIPLRPDMLVVVFDRPSSPGNLGTLIRSCDALRADGLLITGHAVDLYDPETISATTGSFFAVPAVRLPSHNELLPWFATIRQTVGPFQLIGTSAKAAKRLDAQDWTGPTIVVLGNETWGLSAGYQELCDAMVTIPIDGSATSLNVACAASIILYEIDRQRRQREESAYT